MSGDVFSSLIRDNGALTNLTSSINSLHNDGVIDGVEIDWEWPVKQGAKKDRIKLIRYARVKYIFPIIPISLSKSFQKNAPYETRKTASHFKVGVIHFSTKYVLPVTLVR